MGHSSRNPGAERRRFFRAGTIRSPRGCRVADFYAVFIGEVRQDATLDFERVGSLERSVRSTCTDRGAQVLPPAGATVPPWLPGKSARVSNLPACCALGPPTCAAPCSCHHEACSARSAWPHPGKACPPV